MMKDVVICNSCGKMGEKKDYILISVGLYGIYACESCFKKFTTDYLGAYAIKEDKCHACMWCVHRDKEKSKWNKLGSTCQLCRDSSHMQHFFPASKNDVACCNCEKFAECYNSDARPYLINDCFTRKKGSPHKNPSIL